MLKCPRFITEYANFQKKSFTGVKKEIRDKAFAQIDKAISYYKQGFITVDEAMSLILKL